MNDEIKGYDPEEALKVSRNFVKEEYEKDMERFKRHVEPKLDDSNVPYHTPYVMEEDAYANRLIGQTTTLYKILTRIRLTTGDWDD